MHWATPKTDRMIKTTSSMSSQTISSTNPFRKPERNASQNPFNPNYDPNATKDPASNTNNIQPLITNETEIPSIPSIRDSVVEVKNKDEANISVCEDEKEDCGVEYSPTPYNSLTFRIGSPPPEWNKDQDVERNKENNPRASQSQGICDGVDRKRCVEVFVKYTLLT